MFLKIGNQEIELHLKANPDYFMGKTPVENVIFRVIPEGTNRSIALETKRLI